MWHPFMILLLLVHSMSLTIRLFISSMMEYFYSLKWIRIKWLYWRHKCTEIILIGVIKLNGLTLMLQFRIISNRWYFGYDDLEKNIILEFTMRSYIIVVLNFFSVNRHMFLFVLIKSIQLTFISVVTSLIWEMFISIASLILLSLNFFSCSIVRIRRFLAVLLIHHSPLHIQCNSSLYVVLSIKYFCRIFILLRSRVHSLRELYFGFWKVYEFYLTCDQYDFSVGIIRTKSTYNKRSNDHHKKRVLWVYLIVFFE